MNIVLIGKTGCGKTTVAKRLAEGHGIPHVGSGDIAREMAKKDATTRNTLERGLFAPEEAMRIQIRQRLEAAQLESGGFVAEGFPRTTAQMISLLSWIDATPTFVYLECSTMECIQRLVSRGREDDNPDALARKFEIFEEVTVPMLNILNYSGAVHILDTTHADPSEVFEMVEGVL